MYCLMPGWNLHRWRHNVDFIFFKRTLCFLWSFRDHLTSFSYGVRFVLNFCFYWKLGEKYSQLRSPKEAGVLEKKLTFGVINSDNFGCAESRRSRFFRQLHYKKRASCLSQANSRWRGWQQPQLQSPLHAYSTLLRVLSKATTFNVKS